MEDLRNYISTRLDLIRLEVAHTLGELVSILILYIVISFLFLPILTFLGAAAACALALIMPAWAACLVMAAAFVFLMIVLVACRKTLFVRPIQNRIRKLLGQRINTRDYEMDKVILEAKLSAEEERLRLALRPVNLIMDVWEWVKTCCMAKNDNKTSNEDSK